MIQGLTSGRGVTVEGYMGMRLNGHLNAMHVINHAGTIIANHLYATDRPTYDRLIQDNPRGWFGLIEQLGMEAIHNVSIRKTLPRAAKKELETTFALLKLRQGFKNQSSHQIGGLTVEVTPGLDQTREVMSQLRPDLVERVEVIKVGVAEALGGEPIKIALPEDMPGAATETPLLTNIRSYMREAVRRSRNIWRGVKHEASERGLKDLDDVVVVGIGANDMYLQSLKELIARDTNRKARLHVVYSTEQMIELGKKLNGDRTLVMGISRSGGTEDTLKPLEYNAQENWFKHVVVFANKRDPKKSPGLRELAEREGWMTRDLIGSIGGRYMREKGDIVLIPLMATASEDAIKEYIDAMIDFDVEQFPIGSVETAIDMAGHMHMMVSAYNTPNIVTLSNENLLEATLRIPAQLHNEGGGKIANHTLLVGAGMPVNAFAHAGIESFLEASMHGYLYGLFVFDVGIPDGELQLAREKAVNPLHAGLTPTEMGMAFAIPNSAKFTFVGGPNITITMDRIYAANLSTLTSWYVNVFWPYLIMKICNPDSNPQVSIVRKSTGALLEAIAEGKRRGIHPYQVVKAKISDLMAGRF